MYRERLGTHDDAIVDEMIDEVCTDGLYAVVLKGEQLLRAGLFGLEHKYRMLVLGKRSIVERGKCAYFVEHPFVLRF